MSEKIGYAGPSPPVQAPAKDDGGVRIKIPSNLVLALLASVGGGGVTYGVQALQGRPAVEDSTIRERVVRLEEKQIATDTRLTDAITNLSTVIGDFKTEVRAWRKTKGRSVNE